MHVPQCRARRDQAESRADDGRNRLWQLRCQSVERGADGAPKPARRKASLPRRFINRNDAADLQRLARLFFGRAILAPVALAQHLDLRLHNLQFAGARIFLHLAVERDHLARLKFALKICGVEPEATQARSSLPDRELKNGHAACPEQPGVPYFSNHGGHLARAQFGNAPRVQPVFIAKRQIIEQVADGADSLAFENFRDARPHALHVLHRSGKFQHALWFRRCRGLLVQTCLVATCLSQEDAWQQEC